MDRPDDVEFRPERGGAQLSEDDVVVFGSRRAPRWLIWLAGTAAIGLAAGLTVSRTDPRPGPKRSPIVAAPTFTPRPTPTSGTTPANLPLGQSAVLDTVVAGQSTWVLQADRLTGYPVDNRHIVTRVGAIDFSRVDSTARLVLDRENTRVWVVEQGVAPATIVAFDWRTGRETSYQWSRSIRAAATLAGHLYLATDSGLADLAPGARAPTHVPGPRGSITAVAADPARQRVIALEDRFRTTTAWTLRPGGRATRAPAPLPFGNATLAVVGDQIWAGGFTYSTDYDATLRRLDAVSLRPLQRSPLSAKLLGGAAIVATGEQVFWVRGYGYGNDLWCVSAKSGTDVQHWSIPGPVASTSDRAVVGDGAAVLALVLDGCAG